MVLTETATFRPDDAACLVEASLACRVCLSGAVEWSLRVDEWDAEVGARAGSAATPARCQLTGYQALRLSLDRRLT